MKPSEVLEKLKSNPKLLIAISGGGTAVIALTIGLMLGHRGNSPVSAEHAESRHAPSAHEASAHRSGDHGADPEDSVEEGDHETAHDSGHGAAHETAESTHDSAHDTARESGHSGKAESHGEKGREASGRLKRSAPFPGSSAARADRRPAESAQASTKPGLLDRYQEAVESVQAKIETLRHLDEENQKLVLENANLRLKLESFQFDCRAEEAARKSHELSLKLDHETGSRLGRTLANIPYQIPPGILPYQLFPLAINYFKNRDDEKAAVILSFLTGMEEDSTYKTSRNFLLTGIAWYRLDNFTAAESYFDRAIQGAAGESSPDESSRKLVQQARLWKAIVSDRQGRHHESQERLRGLLDFNPHSMEAAWVNGKEARRGTASKD